MRTEPFPPPWLMGCRAGFHPAGTKFPPMTMYDLFAEIGFAGSARDEQDRAITVWLESNEPSLGLVYALTEFGYYRRLAGGRRAGKKLAEAAAQAAWERAVAAGLVG